MIFAHLKLWEIALLYVSVTVGVNIVTLCTFQIAMLFSGDKLDKKRGNKMSEQFDRWNFDHGVIYEDSFDPRNRTYTELYYEENHIDKSLWSILDKLCSEVFDSGYTSGTFEEKSKKDSANDILIRAAALKAMLEDSDEEKVACDENESAARIKFPLEFDDAD